MRSSLIGAAEAFPPITAEQAAYNASLERLARPSADGAPCGWRMIQ